MARNIDKINNLSELKVLAKELEAEVIRLRNELGIARGEIKKLLSQMKEKPEHKKHYNYYQIYNYSKKHEIWEVMEHFGISKSTYYRAREEYSQKK